MAARNLKSRADELLARNGFAEDVKQARAWIMAGKVMASEAGGPERKVAKAGEALDVATTFRMVGDGKAIPYVSRGGLKLAAALDAFAIDPSGLVCADIGISTGGFTDCLLSRGAARVHGVDVGYGQTAWRIRTDPRVTLHERTNARHLAPLAFGEAVSLLTADVSFIGLRQILPPLVAQLAGDGAIVALIKPQFELPQAQVGAGGVVGDPAARQAAIDIVQTAATAAGLELSRTIESPIRGADGNVEYLSWLTR